MGLTYHALAVIAVVFLLSSLFKSSNPARSRSEPFPKGPKPVRFLGNLHQIPTTKAYLTFTTWFRSPQTSTPDGLIGLHLGPSARAVVLNKWTHVRDLLDSRGKGAIYSDRPYFPTADYVIPNPPGTDLHLVFARYGAKWRRARKTIAEFMTERQLEKVLSVQDAESSQMMWEFLQFCGGEEREAESGEDDLLAYHRYAMRYFGAVILASVFGLRGKDSGPQSKVMRFFGVQDEWTSMLDQGATPPLDVFPWLKYVPDFLTPWKGWKERAEFLKSRQSSLYHELFSETEAKVKAGKDTESFLARLIVAQEAAVTSGRDKDIYSQVELDYIGGFLMEGGADTTAMAFETFILAMASFPDLQREVQGEIDAVFGPNEMPHTADGKKLPLLKACFLETLRWRPVFPIAVPHANNADDVYQGYSIPKGTTVIPNVWAICHDPDEFENPDQFNPHRYLANPFGVKTTEDDDGMIRNGLDGDNIVRLDLAAIDQTEVSSCGRRQTYAFGAGRRVCAGSRMAENSMMMTMAKLMWCFDVVSGTGKKPNVDVRTAYKDAILTGPKMFPVKFVLRDERKRAVVRHEWEKANEFLSRFE